jgi:membrane protease YdiL (CAAX protease family)
LAGLFWYLQRLSRREVGLTLGTWRDHGWAVLYPLVVVGGLAAIAVGTGRADLSGLDLSSTGRKLALIGGSTVIMTILTEEGFFRGWLWASLTRAAVPARLVLVITTLGFTLWHISAITLMEEFSVPAKQVPIFLVNATMLGLIWGLLRQVSGSLVVAAVSHGVWNGLTYTLFGFGTKAGALGVGHEGIWGPETGYLGLLANGVFVLLIIRLYVAPRRTSLA